METELKAKESGFSIYPNSVNGTASFIVRVPKVNFYLEIRIYDNLGRLINVLKNKYTRFGTYEMNIDLSDFENGVYYYIAEAGSCKSVGKLNIMK